MDRQTAAKYLLDWIEYTTSPDKIAFIDEPCTDDEILEAMKMGAESLLKG